MGRGLQGGEGSEREALEQSCAAACTSGGLKARESGGKEGGGRTAADDDRGALALALCSPRTSGSAMLRTTATAASRQTARARTRLLSTVRVVPPSSAASRHLALPLAFVSVSGWDKHHLECALFALLLSLCSPPLHSPSPDSRLSPLSPRPPSAHGDPGSTASPSEGTRPSCSTSTLPSPTLRQRRPLASTASSKVRPPLPPRVGPL